LADPERQWRRGFSAFETAVSWELAAKRRASGLPGPVEEWFLQCGMPDPLLTIAVAEHKVRLAGRGGDSQCDVWAIVKSGPEWISLAIEAKALERFGENSLEHWLKSGKSEGSARNRKVRWDELLTHLPPSQSYMGVQYQLLHRCAAAVIEAKRLRLNRAVCIIQSFRTCVENTAAYELFCRAVDEGWQTGRPVTAKVGEITLNVGWVSCSLAADEEVAACA
jgi:hypothetical protein